ncbi:MAG: hypothetical protein M3R40_07090, partial [Pseudomonadota bacterium]|nr:hypothetical protein [Pseudomonadota bacterium]
MPSAYHPGARRVAGVADRGVDRVLAVERARRPDVMQRRDRDDEAVVHGIVVTDRIDHIGTERAGGAIDRRRVAEERIEILHAGQRSARWMERAQHAVDGFDHVPVAHAQSLVGRLDRELIAAVGKALIAMIQPEEAQRQLGIRH